MLNATPSDTVAVKLPKFCSMLDDISSTCFVAIFLKQFLRFDFDQVGGPRGNVMLDLVNIKQIN
jgi:hypothetical protein